uniref:Uncharacterized protein n=1 Tax=Panagrolaimus sp. ES5 TaxID=591445 RepID=A0AC34GSG9_9BILA
MLEGLVTWVLNNYVGEYLENLNADQLSIALLQGQVELENVPIKKTALRKFDVPLVVKSGIIGKLTLSIPITRMRSEPWILKMSDLLVLLGPSDGSFDASDVEGYEQSKKEQLLEALEAHHKTQLSLNMGIPIKDEVTQNQYWGASLVSAVSNNIQLILSNVHIRYEDSTTLPNNIPFNFGIRIQHISIQTTNSLWKAEFIQPSEGVNTFKKLDIKGFSVFWNCDQELLKDVLTHSELKGVLSPESSKENQFILQPFSMQARMEKNSSKFPLKTVPAIPRFKFDLRPEKINIEISKKQLAQIRVLSREWARFDRARQHRKWRPSVNVKENPRMWWKFAINRIIDDTQRNRERCTINFLLTRAKHLNHYCKAYKLKLKAYFSEQQNSSPSSARRNSATKQIPSTTIAAVEDIAFMKQIEHDSQYSYHELHIFRETIFRRLMREKDEERKGAATTSSTDDEKSQAEQFEVVTPTIDMKKPMLGQAAAEQSQGLYGWVSSWFGSDKSNEEKLDEDDINEATFLQMWPNMHEKELPPNLKKIEKKVEEEILDVLNESWDDSTVLRRDNLLAEIVLRLERIIIRFVDDDSSSGSSRVIAMDWRHVTSRLQLSPREHRTEISLSVGDMNVHRLKIEPMGESDKNDIEENIIDEDSFDKEEDEDGPSLLGFGSFPKFSPQLLFAIGRAKDDANDSEEIPHHQENLILMTKETQKTKKPLFQMIYRRMAPRINVLHELDAKFSSISVIYDEDAFNGISNLFDTEAALIDEQALDQTNKDLGDLGDVGETHYYMNFSIPSVLFELRSRRTSLANKEMEEISSPFACAKIKTVDVGISKTEPMLTKLKIGLSSLIVDDLYEKNNPLPLIKTIETKTSLMAASASLSNSCPDLHTEQQHFTTLSSSLPTKLEFRPVFIQRPPQLPLTTRLPQKDKPIPTVIIDNDFGVHSPDGPLLNFIFVDSEHPEYESKYAK